MATTTVVNTALTVNEAEQLLGAVRAAVDGADLVTATQREYELLSKLAKAASKGNAESYKLGRIAMKAVGLDFTRTYA